MKKTPRRTKILIPLVWEKYNAVIIISKFFLSQEAVASGNNVEKNPKSHGQKWKNIYIKCYTEYLLCLQSNASASFLQTWNNFSEQWIQFSHFEGSIIP